MDEDIGRISGLISEAFSKASKLGALVGYVSRRAFSSSSDSASRTYVEVSPRVYYEHTHAFDVGNYLVAVDIRTLKAVGLRIASIRRSDVASDIQPPLSVSLGVSPEGLLAPVVVEASPLLDEDGLPYMAPIEPQSPVVVPSDPSLVSKVAGLPEEGVVMGHLHTGSSPVAGGGIAVRLPLREFFKHLLVIGTTGSGKTTFIKNTIWYLTVHYPEVLILVVDAAGDYAQVVLPPVREPADSQVYLGTSGSVGGLRRITVLLPVLRTVSAFRDLVRVVRGYVEERLTSVARAYHGVDAGISTEVMEVAGLRAVRASVDLGRYGSVEVYVVPTALSYPQVAGHLEALPVFSRQAKIYLRHVVDYIEQEEGEVSNFTMLSTAFIGRRREIERTLKIHRSTLDNIERALNFIASSDCVDVYIEGSNVGIPEPRLLSESLPSPIVLDLEYAVSQGVHFLMANLIAYEVLRSLHEWKRVGGPSTKPAIVVLDEAHRFFPSEGTSAEEVELLADFIARVARLGRSRGLGIVFSTHSPKDVHRIVIQLSNTKVVFRSEREYLEMLDIPQEFTRILELAPDRVALMKSHVIRSGHALFKTAEPLLGHFDIATLLSLGKM
jgi:ABC-type cobalamin/Fe3+-siderophores transport system ATPase subunit